jgi:hypothetical protein
MLRLEHPVLTRLTYLFKTSSFDLNNLQFKICNLKFIRGCTLQECATQIQAVWWNSA